MDNPLAPKGGTRARALKIFTHLISLPLERFGGFHDTVFRR